jgi:hypothetical protein
VFQLTYKLGVKPPAVKLEEASALLESIGVINKEKQGRPMGA